MVASRAKPDMTRPTRTLTILFAAAALFAAVPAAQASPAALQSPTNRCWLDVINDWLVHQPNVVGTYAIPCYTQAIQHLNDFQDIKQYSSAPDDIQRALLAAIRDQRGGGGPNNGGPGPSSSGGGGGGNSSGGGGGGGSSSSGGGGQSGLGSIIGVHDATSIPLPLIVLGALAVLLALAALATWLARRFQERRVQPAPAVPRRR
jgi:hypothetical protein